MDSWRRQKGEFHHHQEVHGTRSHTRKPPHQTNWQPTVPLWEKKFCTLVGSVPWRKLLETKKFMYLYENVVQWNDSAGKEAFNNAKSRFWAEINGLPCNISLPDPDIYIDEIDWNSNVDPELLLDLEREPKVTEEVDKDEKVVILNSALLFNQSFSCTGWGDTEQDFQKHTDLHLAPNCVDCTQNTGISNDENSWERNCAPCNEVVRDDGQRNCWNNSWEWNQPNNNQNEWVQWDNSYESRNVNNRRSNGDWGMCDGNNRKREMTGWYMSRYKTSRFHGDDSRWKNRRGWKRSNVACDRPYMDARHTSQHWNSMNSCGPISCNRFDKEGIPWGWEKQVL